MMAIAQTLTLPLPTGEMPAPDMAMPDLSGSFAALLAQLDLVCKPMPTGMVSTTSVAVPVSPEAPAADLLASLSPQSGAVAAAGTVAPTPAPFTSIPNLVLPRVPGVPLDTAPEAATDAAATADDPDEDDGPVPKGLEKVADVLAAALAAVMAAAGKPVEAKPGWTVKTAPGNSANASASAVANASPIAIAKAPPLIGQPPVPSPKAQDKPREANPPAGKPPVMVPDAALADQLSQSMEPAAEPTSGAAPQDRAAPITELTGSAAMPVMTAAPAPTGASPAPLAPLPAPAEILIHHHLDLAKDGEWLDRLARDIARVASNDSQLRFQLNPEHLGSLSVEIANRAEGTAIRLTADSEAARAILTDAQPRLVAEARAQGLRISEAHVDLGGQPGQSGQQQRQQPSSPAAFIRTQQGNEEPAAETSRASDERYA